MLEVLGHGIDPIQRLGATNDLISLLEFVDSEWQSFGRSDVRTMHDCIRVPLGIENLYTGGTYYSLTAHRSEVWFARTDSRSGPQYDSSRFYLSEVVDVVRGDTVQLTIDRTKGWYDDCLVIATKRLYVVGQFPGANRASSFIRD